MREFPRFPSDYRQRWIEKGLWLDRTLTDELDLAAREAPNALAIAFDPGETTPRGLCETHRPGEITFAEWRELADDLAAGLVAREIGVGDVVAVQLPNWPEMCLLQVALARIGAVIQPMHMTYRKREMGSMLRFCESVAAFVPGRFGDFDYAAAVGELRGELPDLRLVVACRGSRREPSFDDVLAEGRRLRPILEAHLAAHPPDPDQAFYLNFTSGTEGTPKGFLHTHNSLVSMLKRFADMQAKLDRRPRETVTLANSPMTHSYGHFTTYQVILSRTPMVLVEKFDPKRILELIEARRVTSLTGTPAHFASLLGHPDFEKTDVSSVRNVGVGGAQCPESLLNELRKRFGVKTGNTYGMGENVVHTRTLPTDPPEVQKTTVGRPVPGAELQIFSEDHSREMPIGEVGEIAFRGPSLFLAYFKNPEQTAKTRNAEGWFFTGDLGFVDAGGYLHLSGRRKEMINRGGTKIFPNEIEDLLLEHPKVAQAAVVGMPDERLGERICAYIVPTSSGPPTIDELAAFFQERGASKSKIPERIEIINEMPMTPTGKIRKAALAEDARRRATGENH